MMLGFLLGNKLQIGGAVIAALAMLGFLNRFADQYYDRGFRAGEISGYGSVEKPYSGGFLAGWERRDAQCVRDAQAAADAAREAVREAAAADMALAEEINSDLERRLFNAWAENAKLKERFNDEITDGDSLFMPDNIVRDIQESAKRRPVDNRPPGDGEV